MATWRAERLSQWGAAIDADLDDRQRGGFLVGSDPALYDTTLAIAGEMADARVADESPIIVVAVLSISSVAALPGSMASRFTFP